MAVSGSNTVRIRVYFDYPPPALTECRMCWVLVDLNKCRVVADLASIIRDKFDFSRRAVLNLFLEDCYLPPAESVYVVRDNDSIRVKVEVLPQVNGCEPSRESEVTAVSGKRRKREREKESEEDEVIVKKASRREKHQEAMSVQAEEEEMEEKKKKKRKKKNKLPEWHGESKTKKSVSSMSKKDLVSASSTSFKAVPQKRAAASLESSETSQRDTVKRAAGTKERAGGGSGDPERPAAPVARRAASPTSDSSSDSSCAAGPTAPDQQKRLQVNPAPVSTAPGSSIALAKKADSSSSDSSSDTELVIKHPLPVAHMGLNRGAPSRAGRGVGRGGFPGAERGIGRGANWTSLRGGGPRGRGRGGHRQTVEIPGQLNSHVIGQNGQQEKRLEDTLTNQTVILQNPPDSAPLKNYTAMPLLGGPPAVGQTVAFKLLELTENYTPEVSEYKEAKIIGFNQSTNQVELELLSSTPAPSEPGKFDLVYQAPDGSEVIEYAVSRGTRLTERWEALLEPRLVLENRG